MVKIDPDLHEPAPSEDDLSGAQPRQIDEPVAHPRSLTDDLLALLDDGRIYVESEIQFQKTRAAFAIGKGRTVALYGIAAFAMLHLALMALVVGAVIALTPLIGAWLATALVFVLLVAIGGTFAWRAKKRFGRLLAAYRDTKE